MQNLLIFLTIILSHVYVDKAFKVNEVLYTSPDARLTIEHVVWKVLQKSIFCLVGSFGVMTTIHPR